MGTERLRGTVSLSWGPSGGFYLHSHRVCLGCLALTYNPGVEIHDLMEAYVALPAQRELREVVRRFIADMELGPKGFAGRFTIFERQISGATIDLMKDVLRVAQEADRA